MRVSAPLGSFVRPRSTCRPPPQPRRVRRDVLTDRAIGFWVRKDGFVEKEAPYNESGRSVLDPESGGTPGVLRVLEKKTIRTLVVS